MTALGAIGAALVFVLGIGACIAVLLIIAAAPAIYQVARETDEFLADRSQAEERRRAEQQSATYYVHDMPPVTP